MRDHDLPTFFHIAGNLFCIVLSVAMLLVLLRIITFTGVNRAPLSVWVLVLAFLLVIATSLLWLGRALFPNRWRRCSGSALVRRIMEIEGEV